MKTLASIAALLCVTVVATLAAPRTSVPAYEYGLTGNDWWAGHSRRIAAAAPAPARYFYGLTQNDWWVANARTSATTGQRAN